MRLPRLYLCGRGADDGPFQDLSFEQTNGLRRWIGSHEGGRGATVVFVTGLHGNEHTSVSALNQAFQKFEYLVSRESLKVKGNVYVLAGNLGALAKGERYQVEDLNRIWSLKRIDAVERGVTCESCEEVELRELLIAFRSILSNGNSPFIFVDIHTTGSRTISHILMNDLLLNRKPGSHYPLPVVMGVDSLAEHSMLSFVNEMGHAGIGFEAGLDGQDSTARLIEAFFWQTLVCNGLLKSKEVPDFSEYRKILNSVNHGKQEVYEIHYVHQASQDDEFELVPGHHNFQPIVRGQYLGHNKHGAVLSKSRGYVYVSGWSGGESGGFFVLRKVSKSWLNLSALLRKSRVERLMGWLPGIQKTKEPAGAYRVNIWVARIFAAALFKLLGYRVHRQDGFLIVARREGSEHI
ncbi:MAG: hypothetical protein EA392_01590 [Cryomorphaceae bacterium]|nr:MAG: hypothetical protein EA392_01590 [Cryomorphaceae bacterium]